MTNRITPSTAAGILLKKLDAIEGLITTLEVDQAERPAAFPALTNEITRYVALEDGVFIPIAMRALGSPVTALRSTHLRARLALTRLATVPAGDAAGHRGELEILREIFREHALTLTAIFRRLEEVVATKDLESLERALQVHVAFETAQRNARSIRGLARTSDDRLALDGDAAKGK